MPKRTRKGQRQLPSDLPTPRVQRAFERLGFVFHREGGDHTVFRHPQGARVALPRHSRIKRTLLRGILRGVGLSEAEFMEHY